ncbi:MAG: hypothetical protein RBT11_08715 [Desulfobacterales bacterium]|jgi:hypothetical protein|nr:hypothetical protein [Desulfobacterales bacterium]
MARFTEAYLDDEAQEILKKYEGRDDITLVVWHKSYVIVNVPMDIDEFSYDELVYYAASNAIQDPSELIFYIAVTNKDTKEILERINLFRGALKKD